MGRSKMPPPWKKVPESKEIDSGQAHVFQVKRPSDSEIYALKRWKVEKRIGRFQREFEAMQDLEASGAPVPPIIDHNLEDSKPWYVMPWYSEGSLDSLVSGDRSKRTSQERIELIDQVARGLSIIHGHRTAHRDIKPGNILLNGNKVLIADFGLCMSLEDERLTGVNEAVGPRLYTAPENSSGFSDHLDQRPADFYSWGKLAWAVIAGKIPPDREDILLTGNRLEIILNDDRLAGLHPLFQRLLELDPRGRLADWAAVRRDLADALAQFEDHEQTDAADQQRSFAPAISTAHRVALKSDAEGRIAIQERITWRNNQARELEQIMYQELDRAIGQDLREFNDAAKREISADITSGGHSLSQALQFVDFEGSEYVDKYSLNNTSKALLALYWKSSPDRGSTDTYIFISLYILIEDDSIRLIRVPTIHRGKDPVRKFNGIAGISLVSDPLPLGLASTQNAVMGIARESAEIFRNLVIRWAQLVEAEVEPYNREKWE